MWSVFKFKYVLKHCVIKVLCGLEIARALAVKIVLHCMNASRSLLFPKHINKQQQKKTN